MSFFTPPVLGFPNVPFQFVEFVGLKILMTKEVQDEFPW